MVMKKRILLFTLISFSLTQAQLFVKDNSYVYNKGAMVYVKNAVNLEGDTDASGTPGMVYLRNEGQLIQGTTGNGLNEGLGKLSVFQEGTSEAHWYNYWCSPIGLPTTAAQNEPFGITLLNQPTTNIASTPAVILPVSQDNGISNPLSISSGWIWKYIASNIYDLNAGGWQSVYAASTVTPGLGFTMKGVYGTDATTAGEATANNTGNAQRYDFRGKPNDGNMNILVGNLAGPDYANQTLTGNPYPSAINLNLFLLENSGYNINYTTGAVTTGGATNVIDGKAYFWEQNPSTTTHAYTNFSGGYGVYVPNNTNAFSPGTYNNAPWDTYNADGTPNVLGTPPGGAERYKRMFCPIGQGFMVQGSVASGNAVMKNLYRAFVKEGAANNSQFHKNAANNLTAYDNWDTILNEAGVDYTQFSKAPVPQIKFFAVLNNQHTRELTMAFNPNTTDGLDTAMDAVISNSELTCDAYFRALNTNEPLEISTLPFDSNKRIPFSFKIDEAQGVFKITVGNIINFNDANEVYLYDTTTGVYHDILNGFYETTLPQGTYNNYEITFRSEALSSNNNTVNDLQAFQNNTNQFVTVLNPKSLELKNIAIYDITGKLLVNNLNLETKTSYQYPTNHFSEGIYIVNVTTKDGKNFSRKIIIEHSGK